MITFQRVFKLQSGHEYAYKSIKGEITQKVLKRGLSILYATQRHDLFYITVKYHQNILNGIRVIEWTRKCLRMDVRTEEHQVHHYIPPTFLSGVKKHQRGDNSKSNKGAMMALNSSPEFKRSNPKPSAAELLGT